MRILPCSINHCTYPYFDANSEGVGLRQNRRTVWILSKLIAPLGGITLFVPLFFFFGWNVYQYMGDYRLSVWALTEEWCPHTLGRGATPLTALFQKTLRSLYTPALTRPVYVSRSSAVRVVHWSMIRLNGQGFEWIVGEIKDSEAEEIRL